MIVLDTNVVSEALRPQPNEQVLLWLDTQPAEALYLSSVTLAELLFGIGALPDGARRRGLSSALEGLMPLFPGRILPFDESAARHFAEMAVAARSVGRPLTLADGYIAATAASNGFAVATRNIQHFRDTGVSLIDPWEPV